MDRGEHGRKQGEQHDEMQIVRGGATAVRSIASPLRAVMGRVRRGMIMGKEKMDWRGADDDHETLRDTTDEHGELSGSTAGVVEARPRRMGE